MRPAEGRRAQQQLGQVAIDVALRPREPVQFGDVGEQVEGGTGCQGVGAHGERIALDEVGRHRRLVESDHGVRARAQGHGRAAGAQDRPVARRHVDAVRDVAVGAEHAELVDELGRPGAEPLVAQGAEARGTLLLPRHRLAVLALERRLTEVQVQATAPLAHDVGDLEQRLDVERVRRVRRQPGAGRRRQRVEPGLHLGAPAFGPRGVGPAHHLPVGDAVQPRVVQRRGGFDVGDDVGDGGRARRDHLAGARGGILSPVVTRAVHRGERVVPVVEARVRPATHLGHARVLQVRVRVDQARGEHARPVHLVEGDAPRPQLVHDPLAIADVPDAPSRHRDRPTRNGRRRDRKNEGCRIHPHRAPPA